MKFLILFSVFVGSVNGHAGMIRPMPRNAAGQQPWDKGNKCDSKTPYNQNGLYKGEYCGLGCVGDSCLWYQIGCFAGCGKCSMTGKDLYPTAADMAAADCSKPAEPTYTDKNLRSYNIDGDSTQGDWTKYMPWRAPGTAGAGGKQFSPCGISSGALAPFDLPPATHTKQGDRGEDLPAMKGVEWKAGSEQEVEWAIYANHGGGYSYRLCKKDARGKITEADCQKMPLDFATDTTEVLYKDGSRKPFSFNATTTSKGTFPAGSMWRKNPVPMCACDIGFEGKCGIATGMPPDYVKPYKHSHLRPDQKAERCGAAGVQFPTFWDDGYGAGLYTNSEKYEFGTFPFGMVDKVKVPADAKGEYVLSFRWDCEETPQVWNSCADVTVV